MWGFRTTVHVGAHYEKDVTGNTTTSYYSVGGRRIAMRMRTNSTNVVYYLHSDHLGSASLTTDASGNRVGELRYKPYGETRYIWGVIRTDRRFTGQREEAGLGLYDYGARFYDPLLGRFISADTVVPEPGNPQALNRYAYVLNNPLRYTDPTGYFTEDEIRQYLGLGLDAPWDDVLALFEEGGAFEGRWGWLEILRRAQIGDEIRFFDDSDVHGRPILVGTFEEIGESLFIRSPEMAGYTEEWLPLTSAIRLGDNYLLKELTGIGFGSVWSALSAECIYYHTRFDASKFDWVGAALDLGGIVADFFTLGIAGRYANVAKFADAANKIGLATDIASLARSGTTVIAGDSSYDAVFNLSMDAAGILIPIVPDVLSLIQNFQQATYQTP